MRCTIPLPALFHLLRDCVSLIPARTTMPITGHLLLSATDDHITITTTNLETTVIAQCPASVSEAGTVTLPGKKLYEILKELSGEEIRLSHNAKTLATTLECNGSRFQLIGLPPEEFPAMPTHAATPLFTIAQQDLCTLKTETLPSMGHATQQALNTLRIEWHPTTIPTIRTVTTDGKRLTQSELTTGTWLKKPTTKGHALLSPCTAQVLHRLLHYTRPDVITVSIADALLIITLPTLQVTTRLVEGRYPNYETLTPTHLSPCLELTRKDCIESLTRLAIMAPPETPAIDLDLNANRLILHTDNPQLGQAREEVSATILREGFKVRPNARFLLDALTTAPTDHITLNMDTPDSPCILTNGNPTRWRAIIMPIRIGEHRPANPA